MPVNRLCTESNEKNIFAVLCERLTSLTTLVNWITDEWWTSKHRWIKRVCDIEQVYRKVQRTRNTTMCSMFGSGLRYRGFLQTYSDLHLCSVMSVDLENNTGLYNITHQLLTRRLHVGRWTSAPSVVSFYGALLSFINSIIDLFIHCRSLSIL